MNLCLNLSEVLLNLSPHGSIHYIKDNRHPESSTLKSGCAGQDPSDLCFTLGRYAIAPKTRKDTENKENSRHYPAQKPDQGKQEDFHSLLGATFSGDSHDDPVHHNSAI